jgi:hypothetical protein
MDKSQDPKSGINMPDPQIIPDTNGMVPVSSDYNIIILGDAIFLQYSSGSTEMEKYNIKYWGCQSWDLIASA